MQRDSLVHVAATGGYGSVFEVQDGVCEVGLLDPTAEEYSLMVPQTALEELDSATDADRRELLARLALLHLRVTRGLLARDGFELYVGRNEDDAFELWFAQGLARTQRVATLDADAAANLTEALLPLGLDAWEGGGAPCLDGWGWSLELVGAGMGQAAYGTAPAACADADAGACEGLRDLVLALAGLGLPVEWRPDGPHATGGDGA